MKWVGLCLGIVSEWFWMIADFLWEITASLFVTFLAALSAGLVLGAIVLGFSAPVLLVFLLVKLTWRFINGL